MITSFEVGSVFTIVDKATPTIQRIAREVAKLGESVGAIKKDFQTINDQSFANINRNLKTLTDNVTGVGSAVDRVGAQMAGAFDRATASLNTMITRLAEAERGMGAGGAVPWAINRGYPSQPIGGGGGAGTVASRGAAGSGGPFGLFGRRSRGGMHIAATPGGVHPRVYGSTMSMGLGALVGGALYGSAELEDQITMMFWHSGLPRTQENYDFFKRSIQQGQVSSGYGVKDVGEAATNEIRLLNAAGKGNAVKSLPFVLRAGATEARLKGTDFKGTTAALLQQILMTGSDSPQDIERLAPILGFLGVNNPASLQQMSRAASYALPVLQSSLGMDSADVLMMTTAIARAGATNSKSGTWVRSAFERALPSGDKKQMQALRALGLVDDQGKSTILDATGHIDIQKFLDTETAGADKLRASGGIAAANAAEKAAFGEQGLRGVDLLKAPSTREEMSRMAQLFPQWKQRYGQFLEQYGEQSPMQQMRVTWQHLQTVLQDLGENLLPAFSTQLKNINSIFDGISAAGSAVGLGKDTAGHLAGGALIGAIAGFMLGGPIGAGIGASIGGALGVDWSKQSENTKKFIEQNPEYKRMLENPYGYSGAFPQPQSFTGPENRRTGFMHAAYFSGGGINSDDTRLISIIEQGTKAGFIDAYYAIGNSPAGGGGGGGGITNAMYESGGGGGYQSGGVASSPGSAVGRGGFGGYRGGSPTTASPGMPSTASGSATPHFTTTDIKKALGGGMVSGAVAPMGNALPAQVIGHIGRAAVLSGGSSGANAWIAAKRAGFAKELADPHFRAQFGAMLMAEGPTLGTAESAMNRALYTGHSLHDMVTGSIGRKFYSTYGKFIGSSRAPSAKINALIDQALAGSDTIRGFSDQGMKTDPNGPLNPRHPYDGPLVQQHGNIFNDWQRGKYRAQREEFERGAVGTHNDDVGNTTTPAHTGHETHVHTSIQLDGRTVAKNTTKHMVKMGSGRVSGARLADYQAHRHAEV